MHAYEIPGLQFSVPAGATVPRRRFVSIDSDGNGVLADGTAPVVGVSRDDTTAGNALDVADGIMMVDAAEAITAGVNISADADGKAITSDIDDLVVGVALVGAASGGVASVKLI